MNKDEEILINRLHEHVQTQSRVNLVVPESTKRTELLRQFLTKLEIEVDATNPLNHRTDLLDRISSSTAELFVVDSWDPILLPENQAPGFQRWFHTAPSILLATRAPLHELSNPNAQFIPPDELERFRLVNRRIVDAEMNESAIGVQPQARLVAQTNKTAEWGKMIGRTVTVLVSPLGLFGAAAAAAGALKAWEETRVSESLASLDTDDLKIRKQIRRRHATASRWADFLRQLAREYPWLEAELRAVGFDPSSEQSLGTLLERTHQTPDELAAGLFRPSDFEAIYGKPGGFNERKQLLQREFKNWEAKQ